MAINQNHLFEELNGVKCAVVEKNVTKERTQFLTGILEFNHYAVIVIPSPPPKAGPPKTAAPNPALGEPAQAPALAAQLLAESTSLPETYTVGVTDVSFNAINAIFGRSMNTPGGKIVTLAYWQQKDKDPHDDVPYFEGLK
jgi:hypothetical protein